MTHSAGNEHRFIFSNDKFEVLSFCGTEGISTLYELELELVARDPDIPFEEVVGQPASLVILGWGGEPRFIHGLVNALDVVNVMPRRTVYRAVLVPPHIKLTLRRKLRVFQDLTTREIVTQVLEEGGVTHLQWKLRESYKPRNFCVQYRETDMAFISRLLEEEGIAYTFEHTENELKTVFSDHVAAFEPIPGGAARRGSTLVYNASTSMVPGQEHVQYFCYSEELRSGKVQLRDYSFKKPRLLLEGKAVGRDRTLEVYDYPGGFVDAELGRRLANVRLEGLETDRAVGRGTASPWGAARRGIATPWSS